jgi:hypothetical protein
MGVRALDLATYYIDPRMAGCQVLLQVDAKGAQFVVWHAEEAHQEAADQGAWG